MKRNAIISVLCCILLSACSGCTADENIHTESTTASSTAAPESEAESTAESELTTTESTAASSETETVTEPAEDIYFMDMNFTDMREAYTAAYKYYESDCMIYGVWFGDINGNGEEEMVIAFNPYGYYNIYTYENGKLYELELGVMSMWGGTWYIEDKNQILNEYFYGHTSGTFGAEDICIYEWCGEGYEPVLSLFRESGYCDPYGENSVYGACFINDEEVDQETFNAKLDELYALQNAYGGFPYIKRMIEDTENPEYTELLQEHLNYRG